VEVKLHTFLTSASDHFHCPAALAPGKDTSLPTVRKKRNIIILMSCNITDVALVKAVLVATPEDNFLTMEIWSLTET
jgi:adenosylcobinamide amidohydrolase